MITRFGQITKDGLIAYNNLKIYTRVEKEKFDNECGRMIFYEMDQSRDLIHEVVNTPGNGIVWENNGEKHIFLDDNYEIHGYPSLNREYVIIIYHWRCETFPSPHNAVVYKANGELHKILTIPKLESAGLPQTRHYIRENPPQDAYFMISANAFSLVEGMENYDRISIGFGSDWIEQRVLYPTTGEIGKFIEVSRL